MVEKDPSPGAPVPDRILNEEKDEAFKNLESEQGIVTSHVMITPHVTNPSREIILIWRTRSLHDHDHIPIEERERRERIVTSLVTIANSKIGGLICDHLLNYGGTTIRELEKVIPTTRASASRTLKILMNNDVIEAHGYVRSPYRAQGHSGPRVPIFILKGADPQASIDAQIRYATLLMKQDPERREKKSRDREENARILNIQRIRDENLRRVLERIKPPITQLGPLYEILDSLQIVDPEERAAINEYFVKESAKQAGG